MSTLDEEIGAAEAVACLAEARAMRTQCGLSHRGAAAVALYCLADELALGAARPQRGRFIETGKAVIRIPNQDNFDANIDGTTRPIMVGDVVELLYSSGRYFNVQDDIELLSGGYIYRVTLIERKTATLGASS